MRVVGVLTKELGLEVSDRGDSRSDNEIAECSGLHTCYIMTKNIAKFILVGDYTTKATQANVNLCKIVACGAFDGGSRVPPKAASVALDCHRKSIARQMAKAKSVTEEVGFESSRVRSERVHGRDIGISLDEEDFHTNKHNRVTATQDRALYSNRVTPADIKAIVEFWNNPAHVVESPCRSDHVIRIINGVKTKVNMELIAY
jgi:hypothetical protein